MLGALLANVAVYGWGRPAKEMEEMCIVHVLSLRLGRICRGVNRYISTHGRLSQRLACEE